MASQEQKMTSRGRRSFANILSALVIVAYGVFLLLYYKTSIFGDTIYPLIWLTAGLAALGLSALLSGIFRKNIVAFWMAWPFLVCAAINIMVNLRWGTYKELYPIYILIPAIASAFTWLFSRAKSSHLKVIIFFTAIAFACFLQSTGALDWWWALIIGVIAIGAMVLINALTAKRGRWDDGDRPQRKTPIDMNNYDPNNPDGDRKRK